MPALLIVVLHALLLYAFRLAPPSVETRDIDREFESVMLLPPTDPELPAWERKLYQWAVMGDPTAIILPHERLGFSSALSRKLSLPVTLVPAYESATPQVREAPMPEIVLSEDIPDLSLELQRYWPPASVPVPAPAPVLPLPRGIFWRYAGGLLLAQHPDMPENAVAEILAEGPLPRYATVVEIDRQTMDHMTRILVRRSCGNTKLDRLVVAALRREITAIEHGSGMQTETRRPEYIPPPGRRSRIEVDWTLVPRELGVQG
jgi:hypothetical protein